MSSIKPIILTFVAFYLPGYKSGGPVRSISNLVDHLGDEFDFRIVTRDRDKGDETPYPNVAVDAWNQVGKARVFYASPKNLSFRGLVDLMNRTPYDVLYLNSFFSPVFTIRPLVLRKLGRVPNRPVLLAPRGEFSEGALALKRWKKRMFLGIARHSGIYDSIVLQASSEYEAGDIKRSLGSLARNCVIAMNLPMVVESSEEGMEDAYTREGPIRLVFLSRISPMKNLDFALRVLEKVRVPVVYDIYGPIDNQDYWRHCEQLIARMPEHVKVVYHGPVPGPDVRKVIARYDLFFLPTRGENYGHAISEALSVGTPVLISDRTPWRNLDAAGVGWDLPLDSEEEFRLRIEAAASMEVTRYRAVRKCARDYARRRHAEDGSIEANRRMFMALLETRD